MSGTPREKVAELLSAIADIAEGQPDPGALLTEAIDMLRLFRDGPPAAESVPEERIELALADLGAEHAPDPDWQSKVRRRAGIRDPGDES